MSHGVPLNAERALRSRLRAIIPSVLLFAVACGAGQNVTDASYIEPRQIQWAADVAQVRELEIDFWKQLGVEHLDAKSFVDPPYALVIRDSEILGNGTYLRRGDGWHQVREYNGPPLLCEFPESGIPENVGRQLIALAHKQQPATSDDRLPKQRACHATYIYGKRI